MDKVCDKGKACGKTCISKEYTCRLDSVCEQGEEGSLTDEPVIDGDINGDGGPSMAEMVPDELEGDCLSLVNSKSVS